MESLTLIMRDVKPCSVVTAGLIIVITKAAAAHMFMFAAAADSKA